MSFAIGDTAYDRQGWSECFCL